VTHSPDSGVSHLLALLPRRLLLPLLLCLVLLLVVGLLLLVVVTVVARAPAAAALRVRVRLRILLLLPLLVLVLRRRPVLVPRRGGLARLGRRLVLRAVVAALVPRCVGWRGLRRLRLLLLVPVLLLRRRFRL
jgi:hypothetical protein